MAEYFDAMEAQDPAEREVALFARLQEHLELAVSACPGWRDHLSGVDVKNVRDRSDLATLPVLRKPELMEAQVAKPPFGGFANKDEMSGTRVFLSPGPIWELQGQGADPWLGARSLFAAGFREGDLVHNALSYHMTPGGFILDEGLRALGCTVFPGGIGNTEMQVDAAVALQPSAYTGTPDYLKVILDKADEMGKDLSCIKRGLVSGGALFPSLREEYAQRGVQILQAYATADLGVIAYETLHDGKVCEGMVVNENLIVEIVRPGTDIPVAPGEVGELVVTNFSTTYPLIRFGTGDLSALVDEPSPCGRTNMRLKGWMGRADQRTKIKGMFVDPKQIGALMERHGEISGARLVVERDGDQDAMRLMVAGSNIDAGAVSASLRELTKLGGKVEIVDSLPNDGKVISDERDYEA